MKLIFFFCRILVFPSHAVFVWKLGIECFNLPTYSTLKQRLLSSDYNGLTGPWFKLNQLGQTLRQIICQIKQLYNIFTQLYSLSPSCPRHPFLKLALLSQQSWIALRDLIKDTLLCSRQCAGDCCKAVSQSTGHLNGAGLCGAMKKVKFCKKGTAANWRRSRLEGHRF